MIDRVNPWWRDQTKTQTILLVFVPSRRVEYVNMNMCEYFSRSYRLQLNFSFLRFHRHVTEYNSSDGMEFRKGGVIVIRGDEERKGEERNRNGRWRVGRWGKRKRERKSNFIPCIRGHSLFQPLPLPLHINSLMCILWYVPCQGDRPSIHRNKISVRWARASSCHHFNLLFLSASIISVYR